jgi:hypothetical protein
MFAKENSRWKLRKYSAGCFHSAVVSTFVDCTTHEHAVSYENKSNAIHAIPRVLFSLSFFLHIGRKSKLAMPQQFPCSSRDNVLLGSGVG